MLAYAGGSTRTLVPSYSTLCRPAFIPAPRLSQAFIRWGFGTVPGFAWIRCASFKPFGPLALVQQALAAIIFAALCRFRGPALFHGSRPSSRLGAPFWPSGLTVRRSRPPTAAAELRALVPSYSALCRPAFIPAPRLSQAFIRWGFGAGPGFAWIRCAGFKPFVPLALVQQALAAIIFAALCRFRGPALFHGPRTSSRLGAPFWPSGLTLRSSGLAFSQPLTLAVSLPRVCVPTSQPMVALPAVVHSQVLPLAFGRSAGLRLRGFGPFGSCLVTARRLWSHLARAVSLGGCVVFHPAGSNPAVKLTRQRRAAYFVR